MKKQYQIFTQKTSIWVNLFSLYKIVLFCLIFVLCLFSHRGKAQHYTTATILPANSGRVTSTFGLNCTSYCAVDLGGFSNISFSPLPGYALTNVTGYRITSSTGNQVAINSTSGGLGTQDWYYGGQLTANFFAAVAEVDVKGNENSISDGRTSTSVIDNTHFGVQLVGSTTTRTFVIANIGVGALGISGTTRVTVSGTNASDFVVTTQPSDLVIGNSGSSFIVSFTPSGLGNRTAMVSFTNTDSDESTYNFTIAGTGVSSLPNINLKGNGVSIADDSSLPSTTNDTDFGSKAMSSGAVSKTFTIENLGSGSLDLAPNPAVVISGTNASDFTISAQPTSPIAASSSRTFQVNFTPSATGTRNAQILVYSYSPTKHPYNFNIRGTGTAAVGCTQVATATETMTWNGSVSSDWTNPCNWTPNGVPTQTNPVRITLAGANVVIPYFSTAAAKSITLSGTLANRVTLSLEANVTLRVGSTESTVTKLELVQYATLNNSGFILLEDANVGAVNSVLAMGMDGTVLENYTTIRINSTANTPLEVGGNGVSGPNATINNYSCGEITTTGNYLQNSGGVFNNFGYFRIAGNMGVIASFTNKDKGVLFYGGTVNLNPITNDPGSIRVNNNPTNTTIFTYTGTFAGTINGIYTNATTTTSAGTFTAPNTFTPLNTLPFGSQTLYVKITPNGSFCPFRVPFTYNNACTASTPTGVSVNNTAICNGTSVSLAATCSSSTVTWYNTATGGTAIGTGTGLSQSPTSNTTYYASCAISGCESSRVATSQVVVTNIPNAPTILSVSPTAICSGSNVSLTATCASSTVNWYTSLTGGATIGTGSPLTQTPSSSTTYYATCKSGSCESSPRTSAGTVAVTTQPTAPTGLSTNPTAICSGSSTSLSATCISGTITWYNAATGGSSIGTGNGFSQSPTATTTYYVTCKNGTCETARTSAGTVTVTTQPTAPTGLSTNPTAICSGSSTSLSATCISGTITWYNAATGGSSIGSGNGFSQSPTATTTYYASCKNGTCETARTSAGTVTVTTQPTAPTGLSTNTTAICSGSSTSLSATCISGTITWYNAATGGTSIGTGTGFRQSPTATTTYYVTCKNGICETARTSAGTVTVANQPTAPTDRSVNPTAICYGSSTSLSATCISGTITWYNAATGGSSIGTGTGFSQSPTATTTYYVTCKNGTCETARTSAGTVTVANQLTAPTGLSTNPTTICSGSSTSLSATCNLGTITWYSVATGGTSIGTGTGFNQSPTATTTYYVSCKNGTCETARTSAGTVTVANQPTAPSGATVNPTAICSGTSVLLSGTCISGTVTWYSVATGGTSIGTGSEFSPSPTATTTYYASCKDGTCETIRTSAGTVAVTTLPSTPQNVTVNSTVICSGANISLSATCNVGSVRWYNAATGGTSLGSTSPFTQLPTVSTTYYASCRNGSCESGRVATNLVVVSNIPAIPSAASVNQTAICSGSPVTLSATCLSGTITWYNQNTGGTSIGTGTDLSQSPTVSTTYYVACRNNCGTSSRVATSEVVVTNIPNVPINVSVNNTTICSGTSVSLTANCAVGNLKWYNQATGGAVLGTVSPLSQSPTASTTYYAACDNSCGASSRVATSEVVVSTTPNAPTSVAVDLQSISLGNDINLSATCTTGVITWYNQATGGTSIGTGSPFNYSPPSAGNFTYRAACEIGTCKSNRVAAPAVNVNGSVANPVDVAVSTTDICAGNNVSLTANCSLGIITWYSQATGGTSIGTGSPLSQTPGVGSISYFVSCVDGVNESGRVPTSEITVIAIPVAPTAVSVSQTAICNGTSVTLSATCNAGTITWYNQAEAMTAIGTGNSLSVTPTSTVTYYAACENTCNNSTRIATAEVVVTNIPNGPSSVNVNLTTITLGNGISLSASCNSGTLNWYNQATGGVSLGTISPLSYTPPAAGNFIYYAACENGACKSNRVATAIVNVIGSVPNPTGVVVNDVEICLNASISLTASCSQGTVTWYNQATGGTSIGTGSPLTNIPTTSTTYYATCKDGVNESGRISTNLVVVLMIPNSPTSISVNQTDICNGTSISLSGSCTTGTLTWYTQSSGGASIGINTSLDHTPATTTTYFASCENECGASSRVATNQVVVTLIPSNPINVSVSSTNLSLGNSINLSATCSTGTINWYNQATGGTNIGTGSPLNYTPSSAGNYIYYASCENSNCRSERVATPQVSVNGAIANPTEVSASDLAFCVGTSINLSATCSTGTITWYNQATGGTSIGTGSPFAQTPTAGTITYYATCKDASLESARIATALITVTAFPNSPTAVSVSNTSICNGLNISLSATCSTGTITWYNQITGGAVLGTGNGLSQSPNTNTTYYAACENEGCASARVATNQVNVTDNVNDPSNITVSNTNICNGTSISLSATCTTGDITWYNSETALASIGTGNALSQSPSTNTTYYVSCKNGVCESDKISTGQVQVTQNVTVPTAVSVSQTNICNGTSITLSATCATGIITWYDSSTAPTELGTGNGFIQTPSTNTTYYASCKNGICLSNRVSTNQVVVTNNVNDPINISVSNTNICSGTNVSLSATCTTGIITWYSSETAIAALGTGNGLSQTPNISTTYYVSCKDGICESDKIPTGQVQVTQNATAPTLVSASQATICSGSEILLSATCATGTITWYNQMTGGIALGIGNGFSQTPTTTTTYYASCENGICISSRVATNEVVVIPVPSVPSETNNPTICNNTSTSLSATCATGTVAWYSSNSVTLLSTASAYITTNLTSNTTYNVRCESGNCQSAFVSVLVTIEAPINPSILGNANLSCEVTSVTRTASGGNMYLWSNGLGTNAEAVISTEGIYTVTITSANGCTATATTTVTLTNNLTATASNTGPYQVGNTIQLSVTNASTYSWTGPNSFTSSLQNPTIAGALVVSAGVYTVTISTGLCSATATTNVVVEASINPCIPIIDYQFVKAGNPYKPLFNLTNGMLINQIPDPVSIIAVPICPTVSIESLRMQLQGLNMNEEIIQNVSPYAIFDNTANNLNGRVLAPGVYTLTVTGYTQDNLLGSINYGPVITTFTILPNAASITTPTVSKTVLCVGSTFDVNFSINGTFSPTNQFRVELSDANGNFGSIANLGNTGNSATFTYPTIIGTSNSVGIINCSIPNSINGGTNYRIRVVSTNGVSVSPVNNYTITIHPKDLILVSPTNDFSTNIGTKQASNKVTASNKISSTANVNYQAGKAIILNAGFEANAGTVFKAEIRDCEN